MKKTFNIGRTVVGDEHEITKDEIRVVVQPDNSYDLQKRGTDGKLKSIVKGGNTVDTSSSDASSSLYPFEQASSELQQAIYHFINVGTYDGYNDSRAYLPEVNLIRDILPEKEDAYKIPCNIIGYVGFKTSNGGFEMTSINNYIKVVVDEAKITVTRMDLVVPEIAVQDIPQDMG